MNLAEAMFFSLITTFGQAFLTDVEPIPNYSPDPVYAQELYCLSINTYHETRGEDFESKVAVAQAVMNRVHDEEGEFRRYTNPCDIVKRANRDSKGNPIKNQCWYSWYCDGLPDTINLYIDGQVNVLEKEAWKQSILASFYAYHDLYEPLVGEATHYYNFKTASPSWAHHYNLVGDVGEHRFLEQ
jgi:hypothetical protein